MTVEMLTPNIGTAAMEDRERVDYRSLRTARHDRVTALMDRLGLDALMLGREANVRYASGARRLWTASSRPFGPTCVLVRATGRVHLMTFSASYEGAPEEVPFEDVFCNSFNPGKLLDALLAIPGLGSAERIGVDGFSVFMRDFLPNAVPHANFVGVGPELQLLRRDKLPAEVDAIRIAISIAESALYAAAREVRSGVPEKSLQAAYLDRMCTLGTSQFAQQGTFSVIAGDGSIRWITGDGAVLADGDLGRARRWRAVGGLRRIAGAHVVQRADDDGAARSARARATRHRRTRRGRPPGRNGRRSHGRARSGGRTGAADADRVLARTRPRRPARGYRARRRPSTANNASTPAMCSRYAPTCAVDRRRLLRRGDGLRRRGQDRGAHHPRSRVCSRLREQIAAHEVIPTAIDAHLDHVRGVVGVAPRQARHLGEVGDAPAARR